MPVTLNTALSLSKSAGSSATTQTLSGISAAGSGMIEAATAAAQKALLGMGGEIDPVLEHGAPTDGTILGAGTNASTALQAAIDAANTLYISTGRSQAIMLRGRCFVLGSTLTWKSGVHLHGPGTLATQNAVAFTGALRSHIKGTGLTDIGFHQVTAWGVGPDRVVAGTLTDASTLGDRDSFVDLDACSDLIIDRCRLYRFLSNIMLTKPVRYQITLNKFDTKSASKTVAQLDAGTFTAYTLPASKGAVIGIEGSRGGVDQTAADYGVISGNQINCPGLDVGIDLASGSHYAIRCVVTGNEIAGTNCGIQVYANSTITDPGTLTTTDKQCSIVGNIVNLCFQQGIYIRGVAGVLIATNRVNRCGLIGAFESGSAGGINCRSNTAESYPVSALADDTGIAVIGNFVSDCGNASTGTSDAGIRMGAFHMVCQGNVVTRSVDRFGANLKAATSYGIVGLTTNASDAWTVGAISNNTIRGYGVGISIGFSTTGERRGSWSCDVTSNVITNVGVGIAIDAKSSGLHVNFNKIKSADTYGITLRNAPWSQVSFNTFDSCATAAIRILSGNLATDYWQTGNVATMRLGPTLKVNGNMMWNCPVQIQFPESISGDGSAFSRCIEMGGNNVDADPIHTVSFASWTLTAAPVSGDGFRNWQRGERVAHRNPAASTVPGWVCVTAGTFGPAITCTTTTVAASATVTFTNLNGIIPGAFITIVGVAGIKRVLTINVSALTATVDVVCDAAVAAAVTAYSAPVFKAEAALAA